MVAGCGNKCVKFSVFFVNFLIFLAGAALLGGGLWANLDKNAKGILNDMLEKVHEPELDFTKYTAAIWALVGIGAFLMVTGFLGCCGAATENRCLLGLFFVLVLILFLATLACGIAALVMKDKFKDEVEIVLKKVYTKMWEGKKDRSIVAPLEDKFECCGVDGSPEEKAPGGYCHADEYIKRPGCLNLLWGEIKRQAVVAGGIAIGVLVIMVLAMIFTCILCNASGGRKGYYA